MLVVDVIDARAKKLAWRATASDTVSDNPQKNEKKIHKAVEKMFQKYPRSQQRASSTRGLMARRLVFFLLIHAVCGALPRAAARPACGPP